MVLDWLVSLASVRWECIAAVCLQWGLQLCVMHAHTLQTSVRLQWRCVRSSHSRIPSSFSVQEVKHFLPSFHGFLYFEASCPICALTTAFHPVCSHLHVRVDLEISPTNLLSVRSGFACHGTMHCLEALPLHIFFLLIVFVVLRWSPVVTHFFFFS